jgi:hypothetical protein
MTLVSRVASISPLGRRDAARLPGGLKRVTGSFEVDLQQPIDVDVFASLLADGSEFSAALDTAILSA